MTVRLADAEVSGVPGDLGALLSAAGENWMTITGLLALGVLLYWYFAARRESDGGAANTTSAFMDRAEAGFGGLFGSVTSIIIGLLAIGVTILTELAKVGVALNDLVGNAPSLLGHFVWGGLSMLQITGYLPFGPRTAGWLFAVITVAVLVAKFTRAGDDWGEVVDRVR